MRRAETLLGVAVTSFLLVACGSRDRRVDGGYDAGPVIPTGAIQFRTCDPVPYDAGPPPDLGPPQVCFGTPTMDCATRPVAMCSMGLGCVVTQCRGFPLSCASNGTMASCTGEMGCTWTGSACTGTGIPCSTFTAMAACGAQTGCVWSGTMSCGGTTTPCAMLNASQCGTQPGCSTTNPDAGAPDAGTPGCMPCAGTASFDLKVDKGPEPLTSFSGAHVHFESTCGLTHDMTTDAMGKLHVDLDRSQGAWTMTVAASGYAAVSVVGVSEIVFDGVVRLDPIMEPSPSTVGAAGVVSGMSSPTASVRIDAPDFMTTMAGGGGTWSSPFYVRAWPVPLDFCATELSPAGDATNQACNGEITRPTTPIADISIQLPSPAAMPTTSTINVDLPATGLIAASTATSLGPPVAQHTLAVQGDAHVLVGSATFDDASKTLTVRSFDSLAVNTVGLGFTDTGGQLDVLVHDLSRTAVTVPTLDALSVTGTSLDDAVVSGGGDGWEVVALQIGEGPGMFGPPTNAGWRVFVPINGHQTVNATVPHLPAGVHASDLGLMGMVSTVPVIVKMDQGRVWTTHDSPTVVREYAMAVHGLGTPLDVGTR